VERLKLNPDWRPFYMVSIKDITRDALQARANIVEQLIKTDTPPSRDEIRPLLLALVANGKVGRARAIWLKSQHLPTGAIYDKNFEHISSTDAMPFEWTQLPVLGASLTVEPARRAFGMAVRVRTDGSASGVLLRQWTTLSPGPHMLRYSESVPDPARNAFGWSVECTSPSKYIFRTFGAGSGPPYQFDIPRNCDAQLVELHVTSSAAAANSEASFTGFDIE
jgi:hypothetical protein